MKLSSWQVALGIVLVASSTAIYVAQVAVFHRLDDTLFYMVQDLAFVPVQTLLVTVILNELFKRREKAAMQKKMNMVVGAFFSEAGTGLLHLLSAFDARPEGLSDKLLFNSEWTAKDFKGAIRSVAAHEFRIDSGRGDLAALRVFLTERRQFMLGLLENPNLLEHETFTELLWGVFHLTEELANRRDVGALPDTDRSHLAGDIKRAYALVLVEWLAYNRHLKEDYPYMYSFVVRTNPFDPDAKVEVG